MAAVLNGVSLRTAVGAGAVESGCRARHAVPIATGDLGQHPPLPSAGRVGARREQDRSSEGGNCDKVDHGGELLKSLVGVWLAVASDGGFL